MQANREAHEETSPMAVVPAVVSIDSQFEARWTPSEENASAYPDLPRGIQAVPANPGADLRRQTAQESAKHWWAAWAERKVS